MTDTKPTSIVTEYAPWSISKAEVARQCPHRFYLQYILKKKMNVPPTKEALIGKAVHSALEYALGSQGKMSVTKCFTLAVVEHKLTTKETEEARGLQPAVENFIRRFAAYKQKHGVTTPAIEQRLAIDFNGKPTRFWDNKTGLIRGVIDLSAKFKGKPWALILDHKTGKEHDLQYFDKQFNAYALFLKAVSPELESVKLGINFIRTDKVAFKKGMLDVRDIQPIFEHVLTFLNEATLDVHNHELVRPGPLCGWCDYRSECPAHADGADGKQSKNKKLTHDKIWKLWSFIGIDNWLELLREHKPELRFTMSGSQTLKGLCVHPDHQDTEPSFFLHVERGFAKCYGGSCGYFESNPIRLIAHILQSTYTEALQHVVTTYKPAFIPKQATAELEAHRLNQELKHEIFAAAHQLMCLAIAEPHKTEHAFATTGLDWLINTRKLSKEVLHALPVAIMPPLGTLGKQLNSRHHARYQRWQRENNPAIAEPINQYLTVNEYFADYARDPVYTGGILFPLYSTPTEIGNFKIRSPDSSKKFLITKDEHYEDLGLFGLGWDRYKPFWGQGQDSGYVYVLEGEFDALSLMAHYVKTNKVKFPAVAAGGGGGAPYIEKILSPAGIDSAFFVGDSPADKGDDVVQKWLGYVQNLDVKIFHGWDQFPNMSDVDEALNRADPAKVIQALCEDRNKTFSPPWSWAARRAGEEIEILPESDFRAQIEVAATHGKYVHHRLEIAKYIETVATQFGFNASLLKREITARDGTELGFIQNCVDALREFLFVVGTQLVQGGRALVAYNSHSRQFIKVLIGNPRAISAELAPEVGTLESFVTDRVGRPSFLEFPDSDTEGRVLPKLDTALEYYLKTAITHMTEGAPDVMAAKRYKQGYHCVREGKDIQEYVVCGTDIFRAMRDGVKLKYEKLVGPADTERGIVFDIGLTGPVAKPWYPGGMSTEILESGKDVDLQKLYDDLLEVYQVGYKFKNQDITAQMLAALMLCYPVMDVFERPVLVFISGDTNSGKSSLLSTFTGMNYPGIQLLHASQGYESYSAAGVAGYADGDSRLLCLDEFESGDTERGTNVSRIMEMFRGLVSGKADRVRGRPDGTSFAQSFRLPVIFSAIKGAERPQDLNRMLAIEMQKVPYKVNPVHVIQETIGVDRIEEMGHEIAVGMYPHALELARLEDEVRKEFVERKKTNSKLEIEWRLASSLFAIMAVLKFLGKDWVKFLETYISEHEYVIKQTAVSSETHGYLKAIMRNPCIAQAEGPPMTISQLLVSPEQRDDINASNKGIYFDESTKTLLILVDQGTGMIPFHLRGRMTGANLKTVLERHPSALTPSEIEESRILHRVGRYLGAGIRLEDVVVLDAEPWLTADGDDFGDGGMLQKEPTNKPAVAPVEKEANVETQSTDDWGGPETA